MSESIAVDKWHLLGCSTIEGSYMLIEGEDPLHRVNLSAVLTESLRAAGSKVLVLSEDTTPSVLGVLRSNTSGQTIPASELEESIEALALTEYRFSTLADVNSQLFYALNEQKKELTFFACVLNLGQAIFDDPYAVDALSALINRYCKLARFTLIVTLPHRTGNAEHNAVAERFVNKYTSRYVVSTDKEIVSRYSVSAREYDVVVLQTKKPEIE